MMKKLTDEEKREAIEAGKQGVKDAYQKTDGKGMTWWERVLWLVVAGLAAAVSCVCSGCGASAGMSLSSDQGVLVVSRDGGTGAVVVSVAKQQGDVPAVEQRMAK